MSEERVYARLDELGIPYTRYEHPPIASAEAGEQYWSGIDAAHCKNLFMRNQKGTRDRKSTRLNSSHSAKSRMPSSA